MADQFLALSLHDLSTLIAARSLSPVELVGACLDRIAAFDGRVHAFNSLRADAALIEAQTAEAEIAAGKLRGPLHGIPVGIKDLIDVEGLPTTAQASHRRNAVAPKDARVVQALKRAGAIILGKQATVEYAVGMNEDSVWPAVRNPWNLDYDPCGSSSGSAAAVASGFCPGSIGSDTAGSIRDPAAWCGVAGLKPTDGLVSRTGMMPLSRTMDCVGPIAWTARDCGLILGTMISDDAVDLAFPRFRRPDLSAIDAGVRGLRIGVPWHAFADDPDVDAEVLSATQQALAVLADLGAGSSAANLADFANYGRVARRITWPEEYAEHGAELRDYPDRFTAVSRSRLQDGKDISAPDYIIALRQRDQLTAELERQMEAVDILVLPAMKKPAQAIGYENGPLGQIELSLARPFNLTGSPVLSVCVGFTQAGLPLAVQIVGRKFEDGLVLRVGYALERALGQRNRRPTAFQLSP